ncbi:MAG TPA: hypothetical protein VFT16_02890 [Candidatus Saccharimonadales bacterium]|nr:hypothetical protein [Candidatus Saccharimonadales bacterium]
MARLPEPGGDRGDWGTILNTFLSVEHNEDGTLKRAATIDGKYTKPSSGIPASDLSSSVQAALTKTIRYTQTWTIGGYINVPVDNIDYINPIFIAVHSGQTLNLIACRHRINSGTGVTVSLQRNGTNISGFTGISVTTTSTTTDPANVQLADGDMLQLVVTAISGSPQNLSVSLIFEATV